MERAGWNVEEAGDATAAIEKARNMRYLLVLTDLKLPGGSGLDVLRAVEETDPDVPVILMTAYGSVEEAVTAMKEGAFDFIQKPVDLDHLKSWWSARQGSRTCCGKTWRSGRSIRRATVSRAWSGEHPAIQTAGQQVQRVAATDSTVLLLGESGTGKELFARAIHHLSRRREHPFVALNCAAIPEGLVENELFGHEKGAYTGAGARKLGKMEMAQRGTLFLDEIAELPLMTQAKLLRVLEERRFERVGGTQAVEMDARILCATNKNLEAAVAEKSFREDLYFRIAAVPLTIPPLRDRGDDVLLLAAHFLERFCRELSKPGLHLSQEARERVLAYAWPGNIRELQNAIERAVILADGAEIEAKDLRLPSPRPASDAIPSNAAEQEFSWEGTLDEVVRRVTERVERFKIEAVLRGCKWNKTRAAEQLGISYKTLLNKIRDLGIPD